MKQFIEYPNWPESHKILTALSSKKLLIKNEKFIKRIGYFAIIIGIIYIIDALTSSVFESGELLASIGFILIGGLNVINSKVVKWVNEHSSWDERFNNTSSTNHKLIYLLISVVMLACLYFIIMDSSIIGK